MNGPKRRAIPAAVLSEAAVVATMARALQHLPVASAMRTSATTAAGGSRPTLIIK